MKPAVRVSRILAGLAIAALLLTALFARAPGLWDAIRGAPLHDLSLTLPGDPGTYRTLYYPEGSPPWTPVPPQRSGRFWTPPPAEAHHPFHPADGRSHHRGKRPGGRLGPSPV